MTELAANTVIKSIYQLVFEQIRVKLVASIDTGDVTFNDLKDQLTTEFERINEKLNILLDAPFNAAKRHMTNALTYLSYNRHEMAAIEFREVLNNATLAFEQSTSFEKKVLATKLRIISTLHLNCYFHSHDIQSIECLMLIRDLMNTIWSDFLAIAEVRSSIRDEFEGTTISKLMSSKDTRRDVLFHVAHIKSIISEITRNEPKITSPKNHLDVSLYDVKSVILKGHREPIQSSLMVGCILYTGACDNTIKAWDFRAESYGSLLSTMTGHTGDVRALASYQGKHLFSASGDCCIKVWDISSTSSQPTSSIGTLPTLHTSSVNAMVVYQHYLFSGSHDSTIRCWDLSQIMEPGVVMEEIPCIHTMTGHTGFVFSLIIHAGKLFSGSRDHSIMIWDLESIPFSSTPMYVISGSCCIYALAIVDDMLFSGAHDHTIMVWNISNLATTPPTSLGCIIGHRSYVLSLAATSTRLFSSAGDHMIKVWDITAMRKTLPAKPIATLEGHTDIVNTLTISAGKLVSGSGDKHIHLRCI